MRKWLVGIINNERSMYYIIGFFMAVIVLFSLLYHVILPFFTGESVLMHNNAYRSGQLAQVTFLDAFYFSATTQTTVGYGDIIAITGSGMICSIIQSVFGYFYLAFSIAIFACKGILRSRKFELLLRSYQRDLSGANDAIGNN